MSVHVFRSLVSKFLNQLQVLHGMKLLINESTLCYIRWGLLINDLKIGQFEELRIYKENTPELANCCLCSSMTDKWSWVLHD